MSWLELKNLGKLYGYVAYARCLERDGKCYGLLEFSSLDSKEQAVVGLHDQLLEGSKDKLHVHTGNIFKK